MSRELLVMRHAKSDWSEPHTPDYARELNARGRRDAPRIGTWLRQNQLQPDYVLCSTAKRATETLKRVLKEMPGHTQQIDYDQRAYLADLDTLLDLLAEIPPDLERVMLVGHNPGLDQLVRHLGRHEPPLSDSGKLMTTAAVAHFALPDDWSRLAAQGELLHLTRPAELD